MRNLTLHVLALSALVGGFLPGQAAAQTPEPTPVPAVAAPAP
jgi:hypothetical protein